jgi:hypothetical protein
VVPGRPHEREAAELHRLDRRASGEQRRAPRRLRADRVAVEPVRLGRLRHLRDVARVVAALEVGAGRRNSLDVVGEPLEQRVDPRAALRVVPRRVEVREQRVAYEVDASASRNAAAVSSSAAPAASITPGIRMKPWISAS